MQTSELNVAAFQSYPAEARSLAVQQLHIFQQLPLSFLPLLLRELIVYDWRFPAERRDLEKQLTFLSGQAAANLQALMTPFATIAITADLAASDWVNQPVQFSERLTAHLWATHQIDAFRDASVRYVQLVNTANPDPALPLPRLSMAMIGQGAQGSHYRLFRYLRTHGVLYTNIGVESGPATFVEKLRARASRYPAPFGHWYIDGGELVLSDESLTCVSYRALRPVCDALLSKMSQVMQPGGGGPEVLRTQLAAITPEDLGVFSTRKSGPVLSRFELSLLTEGSGTQIFSTTFVQWAAREALRRAQPYTLLARFAPRQQESPIGGTKSPRIPADPEGSLVDADMAAYYTWINQQRLSGADQAGFVVWFEGHRQAVAIGPSLTPGKQEDRAILLRDVLAQFA